MKKLQLLFIASLAILLPSCSDGNIEPMVYKWLTFFLPPITAVITWVTTRYTRKAGTLETMQKSIDMLVEKNAELYKQVTELRKENAELKVSNEELRDGQIKLQKEISKLKKK